MPIELDDRARDEVSKRRLRGRNSAIVVELTPFRGTQELGRVRWLTDRDSRRGYAQHDVSGVDIRLTPRLNRFACWRNIRVSAWRIGPIAQLVLVDEPLLVLELYDWELSHPAVHRIASAR